MMSRIASLVILFGLLLTAAGSVAAGPAEDAAAAFDRGTAQLQESSFDAALSSYAEAARLDPKNDLYRSEESILRRVIKLRGELTPNDDAAKWERVAPGLRAYYYSKAMYADALALDRQYHDQVGSAGTAGMLAESLLQLDQDAEAAAVLSARPDAELNHVTRMLLGIALARSGDVAQAQQVAASVQVPADAMPAIQVLHARLLAGIGAQEGALAALRQAFEATPPNMLASVKENVKGQRDFSALAADAGFSRVMETQSKVKQSSCSGGSSCGACPSRTSCGASGGATEKKSCETDAPKTSATDKGTR